MTRIKRTDKEFPWIVQGSEVIIDHPPKGDDHDQESPSKDPRENEK